eukprot:NODE_2778_length_1495_cov_5.193878_g2399_i0.p1 GENE.NODE_2778_length_1495_cov_5.193878_g2399_i0~~NODE_2778_length_1495_cov_5.193878_g2399_i0.p1  ORF type:complete len:399 (-),score=74.59 NODE_2778_length_1495_cov_5.193878_g2399_i0:166-1362(-)
MSAPKKKPQLTRLQPVAKEEAVVKEKQGFNVSSTGTFRLELLEGGQVEVRSKGANLELDNQIPGSLLGQIRWEDLKIGHVIGEGNQARVRKVKHAITGTFYALKTIDLAGHKIINKRTLQTELSRLAAAKHPNIVSSNDAFFIDGKLRVLMEYMNLGTLSSISKLVGPMPSPVLGVISQQILLGLAHLHASGIVHRDIKPSNLLLNSQGDVKISDFGVSTILVHHAQANTQIGSTAYMSPERIRGESHDATSDVWSVGVTCAECALGLFPIFTDDVDFSDPSPDSNPLMQRINMFDLSALIAEGRASINFEDLVPAIIRVYPNKPKPDITPALKDFVDQCMKQNPSERPSCVQLLSNSPLINPPIPYEVKLKQWFKENGVTRQHDHHSDRSGLSPASI